MAGTKRVDGPAGGIVILLLRCIVILLLRLCGELLLLLGVCGESAKAQQRRKTPARAINSPIKTRRLKKADCEEDFFFMNGYF